MFTFRPFEATDEDYRAIVAVQNGVWPEFPDTVEKWQHRDQARPSGYFFERLLVETGGQVVAFGECGEPYWSYRPGKYTIDLKALPSYQRRGIGTAYYGQVVETLTGRDLKLKLLSANAHESRPQSIRFLGLRGFKPVMRSVISTLDVRAFDPAQFDDLQRKIAAEGMEIRSFAELDAGDPDCRQKFYDLDWACTLDEPQPDAPTRLSFERFSEQIFNAPSFRPESLFIAVDGKNYVGFSEVFPDQAQPGVYNTGFTGVLGSHRRRGIATALKARAIGLAKRQEAKKIETINEENNPMLQINYKLGFKKIDVSMAYEKRFEDDESENG